MLLSRQNLTCHVAATDEPRPTLNGISLTPEGAVSSDGFRLLIVPYPPHEFTDDDFPPIPTGAPPGYNPDSAVIPATLAAEAAKTLPRKTPVPVLMYALAHVAPPDPNPHTNGHGRRITITTTNIDTARTTTGMTPGGAFPNYRLLMPQGQPTLQYRLDAPAFANLLSRLAAAGATQVMLSFYDVQGPVVIDVTNGDIEIKGARAIMMPQFIQKPRPATRPPQHNPDPPTDTPADEDAPQDDGDAPEEMPQDDEDPQDDHDDQDAPEDEQDQAGDVDQDETA